jgi:predicted nucleic acid-binding protein
MQFIHDFMGYGRVPSSVKVTIVSSEKKYYILFEDINDGTSVTNASEQLAAEIIKKRSLNPSDCRFFETYSQYNYDSIDEIEYNWVLKDGKYIADFPKWKPAEQMREVFEL